MIRRLRSFINTSLGKLRPDLRIATVLLRTTGQFVSGRLSGSAPAERSTVSARPQSSARKILVITGPTASGKTDHALKLAEADPSIEIVNADAFLVYRGFDIGTAKPSHE